MDLNDAKTRERVAIGLLCLILIISGVLLIKDKPADVKFNQAGSLSSESAQTQKTANNQVQNETPKTKVNINTASVEDLDTLPGIGATIAGRIVDYRSKNGLFKSTEGLKDVSGIGDAKFEKIKDLISI